MAKVVPAKKGEPSHPEEIVAVVTIDGQRLWADRERWYAETEYGERILALAMPDFEGWPEDVPRPHSGGGEVPARFCNLQRIFKDEFVVDYVVNDVIAPQD